MIINGSDVTNLLQHPIYVATSGTGGNAFMISIINQVYPAAAPSATTVYAAIIYEQTGLFDVVTLDTLTVLTQ